MAKYRTLNGVELEALQEDFIKFLVLNGITAQDWLSIKENQPLVASGLIEAFSDVVFEGIVRKVEYLEFVDQNSLKLFKCEKTQITLIGLDCVSTEKIDFRESESLFEKIKLSPELFTIYKTSKPYFPHRNTEIFKMISSGVIVTDKTLFELLHQLC